ncbi:MAG: hypothetical protein NTY66_04645 [Candidatus Vogelbacteria bacterium]|nr:hypothetical protein [Candidatus Vogelbacteria bacterium]
MARLYPYLLALFLSVAILCGLLTAWLGNSKLSAQDLRSSLKTPLGRKVFAVAIILFILVLLLNYAMCRNL